MIKLPWHNLHFIGIGGAGVAGLALIAKDLGARVSGSDLLHSTNTVMLEKRGIRVHIGHSKDHVENPDIVVYSSAIASDNSELCAASERGIPIIRRGDFLSEIASNYTRRISIAGSHGKTTVAAMLTHIFLENRRAPGYLVGGSMNEYKTPAAAGTEDMLIAEVDESDGSQTAMRNTHAIVTNVDDDHFWSTGGVDGLMRSFREFGNHSDYLLACDSSTTRRLFSIHKNIDFLSPLENEMNLSLIVPGYHNRTNAHLAVAMSVKLGIGRKEAIKSIQRFSGVDRRMSIRYDNQGIKVIEDYAHHPAEVNATIKAVSEHYRWERMVVVFQPHRRERVLHYSADFAKELSRADVVVVVPHFEAWANDGSPGNAKVIVEQMGTTISSYSEAAFPILANELASSARAGDLFLIMGAGTITDLVPLLTRCIANGA